MYPSVSPIYLCIFYIHLCIPYIPCIHIYPVPLYTPVSPICPNILVSQYTLYLLYPVVAVPLYTPVSPIYPCIPYIPQYLLYTLVSPIYTPVSPIYISLYP